MTVGIGLLCENGKSVVVAADRMVTFDIPFDRKESWQIDTDCLKISLLLPRILLLHSGAIFEKDSVLSKMGAVAECSVLQAADRIKVAREEARQQALDEQLRKHGTSLEDYRKVALTLPQGNASFDLVSRFAFGGWFIAETGMSRQDDTGFCSVGSGTNASATPLLAKSFHKQMSIEEGIFAAYESKRIAEIAYGVGRQTDMAIIRKDGKPKFLSKRVIDGLERIYQKRIGIPETDKKAIAGLLGK